MEHARQPRRSKLETILAKSERVYPKFVPLPGKWNGLSRTDDFGAQAAKMIGRFASVSSVPFRLAFSLETSAYRAQRMKQSTYAAGAPELEMRSAAFFCVSSSPGFLCAIRFFVSFCELVKERYTNKSETTLAFEAHFPLPCMRQRICSAEVKQIPERDIAAWILGKLSNELFVRLSRLRQSSEMSELLKPPYRTFNCQSLFVELGPRPIFSFVTGTN